MFSVQWEIQFPVKAYPAEVGNILCLQKGRCAQSIVLEEWTVEV